MVDNHEIYRQLEALVLGDEDEAFQKIERTLRVFCPFEAMGMVDAEIRHSNFLAAMLDPFGPHGLGEQLLRSFIDSILVKLGPLSGFSRLSLHLRNLDEAIIRREWNHIDLLVELPSARLVLVFELKINARESRGQLDAYNTIVNKQWPAIGERPWHRLFFFLTPDILKPSNDVWQAIGYHIVTDAIRVVLKRNAPNTSPALMMLSAYSDMLRRHHMKDDELAEIAQSLWKRHPEALRFLMDQQPDETGDLSSLIKARLSEIAKAASTESISLIANDASEPTARLYVSGWNSFQDKVKSNGAASARHLVWIAIRCQRGQVYGRLVLGPGPREIREAIFNEVRHQMEREANLSDSWTRLASVVLLASPDLSGEVDQEKVIQKLIEQLKGFIGEKVSKFDKPIRSALSQLSTSDTDTP